MRQRDKPLLQVLAWASMLFFVSGSLLGQAMKPLFEKPQPYLRFCYQPGDQMNQQSAPISTQCVYCNKQQFDYTLFRCTGISAVQQYINTTQAFCIISQCLEQIRHQTPVLLG